MTFSRDAKQQNHKKIIYFWDIFALFAKLK